MTVFVNIEFLIGIAIILLFVAVLVLDAIVEFVSGAAATRRANNDRR